MPTTTARAARSAQDLVWVRRLVAAGQARAIRERCGLSQGEVARLLGVNASSVSRWEAALRQPQGATALAYAALLKELL